MCGIIGYVGDKPAIPILLQGLNRLEYRGYDSAGLCVVDKQGLVVIKRAGRIAELEKVPETKTNRATCGIAHTRWATHGPPTERNAHPHSDSFGEIAIVHNGIIENYQGLKKALEQEGVVFQSETDSEVIAHMIRKFFDKDIEQAVIKTLSVLEGALGIAVVHKGEQRIIAARRGSPLLIGLGEGEQFVSSDAAAILSHTNKVIYLEDDQVASVTASGVSLRKANGESVDKQVHEIKWTVDQIEKGGFKHFMQKEIFSQPEAIKNALRGRITGDKIKLTVNIDVDSLRRIVIVACGTSWHSGLIGKHILERLTNIPVEVDYASEFRYRDPQVGPRDLVIAISQSGETADTLAAIKEAKRKGAKTLGIVNVVGSTITREVDSGIYLHAGPEIGVASTKAFTCQIIALALLGLYIHQRQGLGLDHALVEQLYSLPDKISSVLKESERIRDLAQNFVHTKNMIYLGRGLQFPVALEAALKLKEISYIHAEGYPAAEMKHGPIALIDENMPVVFIAPRDHTYDKIISNMEEIKARKGRIIAVVNERDEKIDKLAETVFIVPETHPLLEPILAVLPLQLFAYHVADLKGLNVDKPRNLAKSVTVE
ncbi:MAG TPA: glutamine--fructose-6-phosphate transaminase (isomerizing) [Candidatus Nanoarchaeia archaeon]|nr:glutamine--fructose-6-phosphate transaminase (isomerizing) [Candidatus Nanoarchaeia archaeon]